MRNWTNSLLPLAWVLVVVALRSAEAANEFTVESLDGTYRCVFESDSEDEPIGGNGTIAFDGDGGLSGTRMLVDRDGARQETMNGHYTVNPDGTGTMAVTITYRRTPILGIPNDPRTSMTQHWEHSEFVINPRTGEITFRQIDPDPDMSGRMRKRD